jgi:hypothetical protein
VRRASLKRTGSRGRYFARGFEIVKDFIGSCGMPWAKETNRALMNVGLERGHPIDRCPAKPHHAEPPPQTIDKLPVRPSSLSGSGPGRLDCRGARRSARRQVGTQRLVVFDRAKGWERILTRRRAPEPRRLRPDIFRRLSCECASKHFRRCRPATGIGLSQISLPVHRFSRAVSCNKADAHRSHILLAQPGA